MSKYSDLIQETYKDDISNEQAASSKYSDIIQETYGSDNQISSMKASVLSSAPIAPDLAAQQYQISRATNIPVNIVRAKENEIKQMTELNSIDYDAVARNFPLVATQLSDPNKVGAIRDDVDKLSYFERISKGYKTSQENTEIAPLYIKQMFADIGNEKFKLSPSEENQLAFIEQEQQGNQPVEYKNKGGFAQSVKTFVKNIPIYTAQAIPTILANIPTTLGGAAVGAGIGATATRTPVGALAGAGYGARAGTVYGASQLETGLAYKELKDLVDENGVPIEKTAAAGGAITTGVVNGLLELVPFEAATAPIKKAFSREGIKQIVKTSAGREYLKNIGSLALAEGATEGLQEFSNILFGEVAKAASKGDFSLVGMKDANDTEGLLKFLSDSSQRILQSAEAGLGAGLGLGAVTSGATYAKQTYDQKKQGQAQQEQIKETTQNVKESKTFNRSQELFKDVTEETLGQQNVYIPAEKVQTYFQDKTPQEVEEFYNQVPEAKEQLQDALESGGNLILKGNNAYAAFAQDAYAPLQDFASLSPEMMNDESYQDAFLQDVVSNVNYDENIRKIKTEQDIVNKNIETQIQNLGIPYRDAKDLTTLTKAFYETNLKKYGNEQATKLLNNYFKNLQIKNEVYVDDVAEMLKKARAPQKALPKAGKPLLKFLKEKGGVKLGSNLAGELNALGITPKTAPALFKKDKGIGDVDNIVASEFAERFPNAAIDLQTDYVDRQKFLDLLANEATGADIAQVQSEEQRLVEDFISQLDEMGLDLNAPDEEIKKAIDEYRKGGYNQGYIPDVRIFVPKVRNGWTIEKIQKYLKGRGGLSGFTNTDFKSVIRQFSSPEELAKNVYYHGSGNSVNKGLRTGSTLGNTENFGGGYGEIQHSISLSKSRNIASNFTGQSKSGWVYPIIVKKGANVIERPDIQDAIELEDELVELWERGVDAVKIGDHSSESSEQELVVLNPYAIHKLEGEYFPVYQKKKFENLTKEEITNIFDKVKSEQTYFQSQDQTKTPAFKKWFGDSKVVDEKGEPLVVYHGMSDSRKFSKDSTFKTIEEQFNGKKDKNSSYYFTSSKSKALSYADSKRAFDSQNAEPSLISTYLKIENPLLIDANNEIWRKYKTEINGEILVGTRQIINYAQREGFDGAIIKNVKDFYNNNEGAKTKSGDVYVVFEPTQIKSVENKGTFDPKNANIYYQNQAPTFYSSLEKQITDLPQGKGSPEQWAGIIKNLTQKGVKQEELDWTGIEEWIKEQKGSVTKQQILDYLAANKIEVEEVVKSQNQDDLFAKSQEAEKKFGINIYIDDNPMDGSPDIQISGDKLDDMTEEEIQELQDEVNDFVLAATPKTKFDKYTLAGGENYRELLMTLLQESKELSNIRKRFTDLAEKGDEKPLTAEEQKEYDSLLKQLEGKKNPIFSDNYKSSHYDEPNILAHIRFNERKDKDGKRVMFIEELQSDWHQEGRKKGYAGGEKEKEMRALRSEYDRLGTELEKKQEELRIKLKQIDNLGFGNTASAIGAIRDNDDYAKRWDLENEPEIIKLADEYKDLYYKRIDAGYKVDNNALNGVPNAPFKTTWNELAFKRAMMWAVENDFDKVAWTTGEQQAERYDLSKQLDKLDFNKNKDGTISLIGYKDNQAVVDQLRNKPEDLEGIVGKDIAKKVIDSKEKRIELSGVDLKVGGEGMKAFYDKIVPTMANKLVKKFGGKVEESDIARGKNLPEALNDLDGRPIAVIENSKGMLTLKIEGSKETFGLWPQKDRDKAELTLKKYQDIYDKSPEKENKVHSLQIPPSMRESIQKQGLPLFQKSTTAPRGQFKYLQGKPIISLFQDKNKSTLLHELGHTFLEIQKELSKIPEISEEATQDWKVLEDWLDIKDGNITVESHEKFARGFEAYLREGKAPSIELRTAFARFFTWLTRIYKDVLQLNVKLNNEVREVFDRMLATQEAIDAQKNNPLFRVDDQVLELLNAKEKEDYLKISENAGLEAREKLTKKALRQKEKETTQEYKEQRAIVKEEIKTAMEASPVYRSLNFFKTGELYGAEEAIEPYKLNEEQAKANYPEFYKKLRNKGIFEKDGVDLEIAAEDFGFKDDGVMMNSLAKANPFNQELKRATDEEMVRRFGDMLFDGTIEEEAKDAMQNEARANKILYELNGINRKVKTYVENKEAYKQKASEIFARKTLSVATDSNQFYIAEVKAAREAGKALGKKDYEKAVAEKKKQLLNHYLYRESLQLKRELQTAYKKYAKYKKRPAQGKVVLEEEYREKIVELLANFGLAKMPEGVEFSVADLENWKQEQTAKKIYGLGKFPEIKEFVNKPFKQLTVDEFRTLDDAVENLALIGKNQRFIGVEDKKIELRGLSDSIIEELENVETKKQSIGRSSKKEEAKDLFDAYMATIIKAKEIAIDIDGGKFGGKFYNSFIEPLASGELKRNKMIKEATKKFLDLRGQYLKSVKLNKKTHFKLINRSLDKEAAISTALNWGNEKNRKRIRDGYGWNDAQVNEIISSLTENEWKYVEEIWKFINSYQKDAYAVQKKLTGFTPRIEKASPFSVKTSDGVTIQLQGGYYPIMYVDKTKLGAQIKEQINSPVGSNLPLYKSYTKERAEGKVDKQVNLTLLPAVKHIADVINDIALKEAAWSSNRLLNYAPLRKVLKEKIGDIPVETLQVWLEDMFGVTSSYAGIVERILDHIRVGTTISALGASLATTIIQLPGFVQAVPDIGYLNTIKGIYKFIGNANPLDINANRKKALEKSKVLQSRAETFNQAIYDVLKDMAGKGMISRNAIPFFFYPMQVAQSVPDTIVWYGAYSKGLKDFKGDDAKAVKYADYIVVKTQGSGLTQDLSAIERGSLGNVRRSKIIRLFTAFGTYFVAKFNVARRSFKDTNFKNPIQVAKFMSDMLALYLIEAIAGEIILNRIPDFDDEDEDAYAGYVFKTMMQTFASQFFLGREAVGLSKGFDGTPSGFGGLKKAYQGSEDVFEQTINAFTGEEVEMTKIIKGANKSASVLMHFPSTPIDTLVTAYEKELEGEEVAPIDYFIKPRKK